MSPVDKDLLDKWIEKADHDLMASDMILEINPVILDIACFHCQQAIEKYLKAFLLFKGQELIKTHNLHILLKECITLDGSFSAIDIKNLNLYAVRARYPEFIAPELSEAKEYYQIALAVKELVLSKVEL